MPFPTSKCLLLLLLQLYCLLLLSAEATTHHIWRQHSSRAEKHPSYSKLQPQTREHQRHLVIRSQHGDGKRGKERDGEGWGGMEREGEGPLSHPSASGWQFCNKDMKIGKNGPQWILWSLNKKEKCLVYLGTLWILLSFMYIEFCGCLCVWRKPKLTTVTK